MLCCPSQLLVGPGGIGNQNCRVPLAALTELVRHGTIQGALHRGHDLEYRPATPNADIDGVEGAKGPGSL